MVQDQFLSILRSQGNNCTGCQRRSVRDRFGLVSDKICHPACIWGPRAGLGWTIPPLWVCGQAGFRTTAVRKRVIHGSNHQLRQVLWDWIFPFSSCQCSFKNVLGTTAFSQMGSVSHEPSIDTVFRLCDESLGFGQLRSLWNGDTVSSSCKCLRSAYLYEYVQYMCECVCHWVWLTLIPCLCLFPVPSSFYSISLFLAHFLFPGLPLHIFFSLT